MTVSATLPVTLDQVLAAHEQILGRIHRTPVTTSLTFDRLTNCHAFFKCEHLQRGGSFKVRGAMNRLTLLSEQERQRGVVAFSSGNHAQGVAISARDLRIPATIVMPTDAPQAKLQATEGYGAQIRLYDRQREDREAIARDLAGSQGLTLVPPYDNPHIIAGQGTVAFELFDQVGDLDVLIAPVGGGGLLSGCSIVARSRHPQIRIYGVEPETGNDTYLSFQTGARVSIPLPQTLADGVRTQSPGELTFEINRQLVDGIVLVSEEEILAAMRFLLWRMKMLVEPTGAVATAALLAGKIVAPGQRVGVILSGGNVDAEILKLAL